MHDPGQAEQFRAHLQARSRGGVHVDLQLHPVGSGTGAKVKCIDAGPPVLKCVVEAKLQPSVYSPVVSEICRVTPAGQLLIAFPEESLRVTIPSPKS